MSFPCQQENALIEWATVSITGKNLKKNVKKEKEILPLSNDVGDEPCKCGHPRRSHLGPQNALCFGCYQQHEPWYHDFKLDNLTYIEKLYSKKQLEKFKRES